MIYFCIPSHDEAGTIGLLLWKIRRVLEDSGREYQLLVGDDGSTDATGTVAEGFKTRDDRVKIVDKANGGLSSARNAGIAAASGDLICFLDADDILLPDKLQRQVAFLDEFKGCDLVYSDYYVGDGELTPVWLESVQPGLPRMDQWLLYRTRFAPMSPLLRARLVAATGDFDQTLRAAEDWDYWIRAAQQGQFCYLPGAVGVYRVHPAQMHHDLELMRTNGRRVADKNFERGSRNWRV